MHTQASIDTHTHLSKALVTVAVLPSSERSTTTSSIPYTVTVCSHLDKLPFQKCVQRHFLNGSFLLMLLNQTDFSSFSDEHRHRHVYTVRSASSLNYNVSGRQLWCSSNNCFPRVRTCYAYLAEDSTSCSKQHNEPWYIHAPQNPGPLWLHLPLLLFTLTPVFIHLLI